MRFRDITASTIRLEKPVRITEQAWPEGTVPVVSVFCITYNHVNFVRDAIEGFLMQKTNFPVEIFIHDDASTDGTAEILNEYAEKYPNLFQIVLQTENQWSKGNFNRQFFQLIKEQRGEYIALCEGDDYWLTAHKLQMQVDFLCEKADASFCFHKTSIVNEKGALEGEIRPPSEKSEFKLDDLVFFNFIHTSSILLKKGVFNGATDIFEKAPMGDWPLCILLAEKGNFYYMAEIVSFYRLHAGGYWSAQSQTDRIIKTCEFFEIVLEYFNAKMEIYSKILHGFRQHCFNAASELNNSGEFSQALIYYAKFIESYTQDRISCDLHEIKYDKKNVSIVSNLESFKDYNLIVNIATCLYDQFLDIQKNLDILTQKELEIRILQNTISDIQNSKVWKLSWPVRYIYDKIYDKIKTTSLPFLLSTW